MKKPPDIPEYHRFLTSSLLADLWDASEPVGGVEGLRVARGLREAFPQIETVEALGFVCRLYDEVKEELSGLLEQRTRDREFMDRETLACSELNEGLEHGSPDYQTVIGRRDPSGRVVIGPIVGLSSDKRRQVRIPEYLEGDQVTLFGPPDTAKMSINAMNSLNRISPDEPPIVGELLGISSQVPRWGADNEDSKTPIMEDFLRACSNLTACFDGSLRFEDERSGRVYQLDEEGLSKPIKRIPGLALPDGSHLFHGDPLPLHLFDLAVHLWHNRKRAEALVFYIPKLENEEEARYLKFLIDRAELAIQELEPDYCLGTIKLFVVFENPRAIFRIAEIAEALHPHFLGGSLGWHDFLASTARLFKNDARYRIPVKADPDIVINHIRESHRILVSALQPVGAIRIGGMYGVLFEEGNARSYEVSMVGYIRDVATQLKRGLNGFWVAHPAFVRPGLAMVEAWRGGPERVSELIKALIPNPAEHEPLLNFVFSDDAPGLDPDDPKYLRSVLAAGAVAPGVISNDDPQEVRYNVFQALQYICDWMCGNGCVALPATMKNQRGEMVFVRIMDDLATTERSRWELWAEIRHGRVSREEFLMTLREEVEFLKLGVDEDLKRIQVPWRGEAERWYPVAVFILHQLVMDPEPVEFATELMMPFTMDLIRGAEDPLAAMREYAPGRFEGWSGMD